MQEDNEREKQLIGDSKQDKPRRVSLENMEEKEKPFIQEKVKKKKKTKGKKFFLSFIMNLVLGLAFGVTACVGFFASKPYISEYFKEKEKTPDVPDFSFSHKEDNNEPQTTTASSVGIVSPGSVETTEPDKDDKPQPAANPSPNEQKEELTLKDYYKLSNKFSEYAKKLEKSILTVTSVKEKKDIFDHTEITADSFYGLVLGEHGKKLLVIAPSAKIKENNKIQITFHGGTTLDAELINQDSELGIAVLGILLADIPDEVYNDVEIANFGESYYLSVGTPVMALGSPNGYMFSRQLGSVATKSYIKYIEDDCVELFNTDMMVYKQGEGFLVNLNGEVVGFLTHDFSDEMNEEMCVIMGITKLKKNIEGLINGKSRASFGITAWDMTKESLESLGIEKGIYVSEVIPDSAAYEAGIINGDVIVRMGGKEVSSVEEFQDILRTKKPEDVIKVVILRTAKSDAPEITMDVTLKEYSQ